MQAFRCWQYSVGCPQRAWEESIFSLYLAHSNSIKQPYPHGGLASGQIFFYIEGLITVNSTVEEYTMPHVALTDTVTITYTAALENGEIIAKQAEALPVAIGSGAVCKAVEACLFGMEPGQTRVIAVQPEDAFGLHVPELVQEIPLTQVQGKAVQPGMILSLQVQQEGKCCQVPATVKAVGERSMTVDYNHPLAGEVIVYTVTLLSIAA